MRRRDFVKSLGVAGALAPFAPAFAQTQQGLQTNPQSAQIGDLIKPDDPIFEGRAHRAVWGRTGAVAAADQQGSLAGAKMLMKGGNAIDAIIATAAALNVV